MRQMLCVVVLCVVVGPMSAQVDGNIWPDFKVGKVGHFKWEGEKCYTVKVFQIISKDSMVVSIGRGTTFFLVTGYPTKDLADDSMIELKGQWKVTGTKKVNGSTRYVVEPVKEKK